MGPGPWSRLQNGRGARPNVTSGVENTARGTGVAAGRWGAKAGDHGHQRHRGRWASTVAGAARAEGTLHGGVRPSQTCHERPADQT